MAAWIQQDVWSNIFTSGRIIGTIVGTIIMMIAIVIWEKPATSNEKQTKPVRKSLKLKRESRIFQYGGLLWVKPWLRFQYPTPVCPIEGCGREIFYKEDSSLAVRPISKVFLQLGAESNHIYECPKHGNISGVPNIPVNELQEKAKLFYSNTSASQRT